MKLTPLQHEHLLNVIDNDIKATNIEIEQEQEGQDRANTLATLYTYKVETEALRNLVDPLTDDDEAEGYSKKMVLLMNAGFGEEQARGLVEAFWH